MTDTLNRVAQAIESADHQSYEQQAQAAIDAMRSSEISAVSAFTDKTIQSDLIKEDRLQQMEAHAEEGGKFPYPASTVLELIHHIRAVEKVRDEWCMEYVRLRDAPKRELVAPPSEMGMRMSDVRVGMKLKSLYGGPEITVTELTKKGFRYKHPPYHLGARIGQTEGGEHFGYEGYSHYTKIELEGRGE